MYIHCQLSIVTLLHNVCLLSSYNLVPSGQPSPSLPPLVLLLRKEISMSILSKVKQELGRCLLG